MTVTTYCIPRDVEHFLMLQTPIDQNSIPSREVVERYILMAEGKFEEKTGTAYRPILVQNEVYDLKAWRGRYKELFNNQWFAVPRPIHIRHRPLLPLESSRGHKVEVYEGSEESSNSQWKDWISNYTRGRNAMWWVDEQTGIIYVRKTWLVRRANLLRMSYEYGKPIATLDGALTSSATTIPVTATHYYDDTYRYQTRGLFRIDDEYIWHTGKTASTFTNCTRGALDTEAVSHDSGAEVVEVPDNARRLITQYAAALLMENEVFISVSGDNAGSAKAIGQKVDGWKEEFEKATSSTYQRWSIS